jgi:hypothetical protein
VAGILWRAMVILHRYLGIMVGLLMATWFVSGIVMMYLPYSRIILLWGASADSRRRAAPALPPKGDSPCRRLQWRKAA